MGELDTYGAQYDESLAECSTSQLWDALTGAERIFSDRQAEFDNAMLAHTALLDAYATVPASHRADHWQRVEEAYAEMRGAHAAATEQGKMVTAINRAIRIKTTPAK